jgi:anti-sigma factor RsiW
MSEMPGTQDCGGDAAAYVLGALEPSEAEAFRRHMNECVVCRDEVESLGHVADALPMSAPQHPVPRALRRRVLAEVRADARATRRGRARAGARIPGSWLPRPALAAGLAAVVAIAVVGGVEIANSGGPSTRVVEASLGQAELRVTGTHAELVVNHLPAPAPGHIYEVWLQRGAHSLSPTKALFSVTSSGTGDVDVPGNLRGVNTVLVTQEPAGGSPVPTSKAVIVAHL